MSFDRETMARLARKQREATGNAVRPPTVSIGMALVTAANPYQSEVQLTTGAGTVLDGIRVIHPVTPDSPLRPGELAVVASLGLGGMFCIGRHALVGEVSPVTLL